jgi:hypothetical protein
VVRVVRRLEKGEVLWCAAFKHRWLPRLVRDTGAPDMSVTAPTPAKRALRNAATTQFKIPMAYGVPTVCGYLIGVGFYARFAGAYRTSRERRWCSPRQGSVVCVSASVKITQSPALHTGW